MPNGWGAYNIGSKPADTGLTDLLRPEDERAGIGIADCVLYHNELVEIIEVRDPHGNRIGAMTISVTGNKETGRLDACGLRTFSELQIQTGAL